MSNRFAALFVCVLILAGCDRLGPKPKVASAAASQAAKSEDAEKDEFKAIVRKNAEDPGDLEIVQWGEKKTREEGDQTFIERDVKFRCKLVGFTPFVPRSNSPMGGPIGQPGGDKVMLEQARISYDGNKIRLIHCYKTGRGWLP